MFLNVNTIDSTSLSWTRSTLSHDQVTQWTKAKVRIYSDSVLCLGRCHCTKKQLQDGKVKWKNFEMSVSHGELLEVDGEAIEFEWKIFAGFTSLQNLQEI